MDLLMQTWEVSMINQLDTILPMHTVAPTVASVSSTPTLPVTRPRYLPPSLTLLHLAPESVEYPVLEVNHQLLLSDAALMYPLVNLSQILTQ